MSQYFLLIWRIALGQLLTRSDNLYLNLRLSHLIDPKAYLRIVGSKIGLPQSVRAPGALTNLELAS